MMVRLTIEDSQIEREEIWQHADEPPLAPLYPTGNVSHYALIDNIYEH